MGLFHTFKSLKDSSEKLVKLKQSVLLEGIYDAGLIAEAVHLRVKNGVCAGLTMRWLGEKVYGSKAPHGASSGFISQRAVDAQFNYDVNFDLFGQTKALKQLALECKLNADSDRGHPWTEFLSATEYWHRHSHRGDSIYLMSNMTNGSGHSVGLFKDQDQRFHFFDANVGEYLIHKGKFDHFFTDYISIYRDSSKLEYKETFGIYVTK